jgi:hypothetical protein
MRWDPTREPGSRFVPETDAEQRFSDLRDSGYTGWINQDGNAVTSYTDPLTGAEHALPPNGFDCTGSESR